jgi:hypothetical protein
MLAHILDNFEKKIMLWNSGICLSIMENDGIFV